MIPLAHVLLNLHFVILICVIKQKSYDKIEFLKPSLYYKIMIKTFFRVILRTKRIKMKGEFEKFFLYNFKILAVDLHVSLHKKLLKVLKKLVKLKKVTHSRL